MGDPIPTLSECFSSTITGHRVLRSPRTSPGFREINELFLLNKVSPCPSKSFDNFAGVSRTLHENLRNDRVMWAFNSLSELKRILDSSSFAYKRLCVRVHPFPGRQLSSVCCSETLDLQRSGIYMRNDLRTLECVPYTSHSVSLALLVREMFLFQ